MMRYETLHFMQLAIQFILISPNDVNQCNETVHESATYYRENPMQFFHQFEPM